MTNTDTCRTEHRLPKRALLADHFLTADVRGCSSREIAQAIKDAKRNLAMVIEWRRENPTRPNRVQWWEGWVAALEMAQRIHAENEARENGNGYRG